MLLIPSSDDDHISFVAINTHTKRWYRLIARRANVMLVHYELFADVSIVKEHGVGLQHRQTTLWPTPLCQSRTCVATKCHQDGTNEIPIYDQRFMGVPHTTCDVFLTQFFQYSIYLDIPLIISGPFLIDRVCKVLVLHPRANNSHPYLDAT